MQHRLQVAESLNNTPRCHWASAHVMPAERGTVGEPMEWRHLLRQGPTLTFCLLIALFQVLPSSTPCWIILIAAVPKIFSTSVSALFARMLHIFKTKFSPWIYATKQREGSYTSWSQRVQNKHQHASTQRHGNEASTCHAHRYCMEPACVHVGPGTWSDAVKLWDIPGRSGPGWRCCPPPQPARGMGWLLSQWGWGGPWCSWRCPRSRPPSSARSGHQRCPGRSLNPPGDATDIKSHL